MITKVAGGIIGLGLIGTGGVAIARPGWFGISNMPSYTKLSEDHDFGTDGGTDYKGKFGAAHKDDLVGIVGKESGQEGNKDWWEWSFERLKNKKPNQGKFKYVEEDSSDNAVTKAYDKENANGNSKALNQVCKGAYKESESEIKSEYEDNKYKAEDVWKWCSPGGKKPDTSIS